MVKKEPFHEPDVSGHFKAEFTECDACGETLLSFEQADTYTRSYAAAVARARNAITPERILEVRLSLGWSQAKIEEAFGVGPKTWGRWERGTIAPSGPAARLLWIAENDREAFHRMTDSHDPRRQRHIKIAGSIAQQGPGEPTVGYRAAKPVAKRNLTMVANGAGKTGGAV